MKTIGVTGGSGFIGGYVREKLQERGFEVVVFDRVGVENLAENEHVFLGDIRDATDVTELAAHVDGIIHLAAVLGTQETIGNPRPAVETNVIGGLNVLEAANQYNLPVVYAGVGNYWMREHGGGTYTITKTIVEDFAKMFNQHRNGRISVVRPVNAYGPRQSIAAPYGSSKVRKVIPSLTCRALTGDPIELYGGGVQVSDCVHVADVAKVFVEALIYTENNSPVTDIEVGPHLSHSVLEIAEMVRSVAFSLTGAESELVSLPMRPGEVPGAVVSANTATLSVLNMSSADFISLEDGIQETVEWYYKNWLPQWKS